MQIDTTVLRVGCGGVGWVERGMKRVGERAERMRMGGWVSREETTGVWVIVAVAVAGSVVIGGG